MKEHAVDEKPTLVSRRQFATCAAAAAAGWVLTACGPRRLHDVSTDRLKQLIADLEREYKGKYGKDVTVSDAGPMPGVLFGYALDISRCIGCRRCVYACTAENNQSRDPQVHWIRVLQMDKDAWQRNSLDHRERVSTLTDEQFKTVYEYLSTNFGPHRPVPKLPKELLKTWTGY